MTISTTDISRLHAIAIELRKARGVAKRSHDKREVLRGEFVTLCNDTAELEGVVFVLQEKFNKLSREIFEIDTASPPDDHQ